MTEIVVVIGIVGVLMSLVLPGVVEARRRSRMTQCISNMRQLSQALSMYDTEHNHVYENYPDRLTHLFALGYTQDTRIFVCPMDYTKAEQPTLKPGNANDNKSDWAERRGYASNGMPEQNCSYLYEFSTRPCQNWTMNYDDPTAPMAEWTGSGWPSNTLVGWMNWDDFSFNDDEYVYDDFTYFGDLVMLISINPRLIDRDPYIDPANHLSTGGNINWQEAKFSQLVHGDVYTTGYAAPGENGIPLGWTDGAEGSPPGPYWPIAGYEASPMRGYPRTWLPIVRCFWHCDAKTVDDETIEQVLNMAVDGNTFYSVPGWEQTAWKYGRNSEIQQ
jgi:type II secretory pathway pseudopilin PulG